MLIQRQDASRNNIEAAASYANLRQKWQNRAIKRNNPTRQRSATDNSDVEITIVDNGKISVSLHLHHHSENKDTPEVIANPKCMSSRKSKYS